MKYCLSFMLFTLLVSCAPENDGMGGTKQIIGRILSEEDTVMQYFRYRAMSWRGRSMMCANAQSVENLFYFVCIPPGANVEGDSICCKNYLNFDFKDSPCRSKIGGQDTICCLDTFNMNWDMNEWVNRAHKDTAQITAWAIHNYTTGLRLLRKYGCAFSDLVPPEDRKAIDVYLYVPSPYRGVGPVLLYHVMDTNKIVIQSQREVIREAKHLRNGWYAYWDK